MGLRYARAKAPELVRGVVPELVPLLIPESQRAFRVVLFIIATLTSASL